MERVYRGLKHCALSTNEKKTDRVSCVCMCVLFVTIHRTYPAYNSRKSPAEWPLTVKFKEASGGR